MGAWDGAAVFGELEVGAAEGFTVGHVVGLCEGEVVGLAVGLEVVGLAVGLCEGEVVGLAVVGWLVGIDVTGWLVVGYAVGDALGAPVNPAAAKSASVLES